MIRVILKGGLGNQMFQYAAGKSIALRNNTDLVLDTTFLKTRIPIPGFTYREYELDLYPIIDKTDSFLNLPIANKYISYPLQKVKNKFDQDYISEGPNPYAYNHNLKRMGYKLIMEGYWNNYKYFKDHEVVIKEIFDLERFYDPKYKEIEDKIKSDKNSVSINIRRGDYINKKHKDVYVALDIDYYKNAIEILRDKIEKPHFYVFSYDDPDWIKYQLNFNEEEITIIGRDFVGEKFKTYFRLISLCRNNIISNSTFAWWAAYLNKNREKITIGPKKWMYKYNFEYPDDWEVIENN